MFRKVLRAVTKNLMTILVIGIGIGLAALGIYRIFLGVPSGWAILFFACFGVIASGLISLFGKKALDFIDDIAIRLGLGI